MYLHIVYVIAMFILSSAQVISPFTFSNENEQPVLDPNQAANTIPSAIDGPFARQLISGTVPTFPTTSTLTTCICVPTGQCTGTGTNNGLIDIRIVNNQGSTITPPIVCGTGLVVCCQNGPYQCGVRYYPIQGTVTTTPPQAPFGSYPWQAAILSTANVYLGSGALISSRHVLTVAHKVATLAISTYKVRLGEWDAGSTSEPIPAQEYTISVLTVHPSYNSNNLQNSIAIITLSTSVQLGQTPTIATVCLTTTFFTGQRCYVSGWGKNDFGPSGQYQAIQKQVDVPIRSSAECQTMLSATRLGPSFVFNSATFMCAGGEAGKDACTGDGGSPLVCQSGSRWYVTGLVAWGIGCAIQGVPGVYINVAAYIPWIQNIIN